MEGMDLTDTHWLSLEPIFHVPRVSAVPNVSSTLSILATHRPVSPTAEIELILRADKPCWTQPMAALGLETLLDCHPRP